MPTDPDPNDPKPLTAEDVTKLIDGRLGVWSKGFEKKNADTIKSALGELAPELDKLLEGKLESLRKGAPEPQPKPGDLPAPPPKVEDHPAFKGLQRTVEDLRKQTETAKQERDAERAKTQQITLRKTLTEELARRGFKDPLRIEAAVDRIVDSKKLVGWTDDGASVVWKDADGERELGVGIEAWLKTPDAKLYQDPRGAAGSGARPGGRPPGGKEKTEATYEDVGNFVLSQAMPMGVRLGE
jgi:hypothetical protein